MDGKVLHKILHGYGLQVQAIARPQNGYRNYSYRVTLADGRMANLILYKQEPHMLARIRRANVVGDYAADHGLPARHTFSSSIARLQQGNIQKYAALYHYLPGSTIPWEAYTMEHIKNLGGMLGTLHATLATLPMTNLPDVAAEQLALLTRMQHYFAEPGVRRAMRQKLGLQPPQLDFAPLLQACQQLPNQQALHMDFVRGNILFTGTAITGILDFEKTARGNVIFDLARTLAFLLVDCKYKLPHKIYKYFLPSGYVKRGSGQLPDAALLGPLVDFFLLYDFYKFLRHNPYESLAANQHFTRTKMMLLKRGRISPIE